MGNLETVLWIHKRKSVLGEYIEIFRIEEPQCLQPNFQQLPKKKITPFLYLITTSICLCLLSRERRQTCQMLLIPEPELQGHENFFDPILATPLQENTRSYQNEKDRRQLSLSGLAQGT